MGYVSHLSCSICGADYPAEVGHEPVPARWPTVQVVIDLKRLKAERGA